MLGWVIQLDVTVSLRLTLSAPAEVQIKVQVFDNSDLSPLADAQVEVHGNQSAILASSRAGSDGVLRVSFLYRTGTWVVITASKPDYVTNSVPWHSGRIPRKSQRRKTPKGVFVSPPDGRDLISRADRAECLQGRKTRHAASKKTWNGFQNLTEVPDCDISSSERRARIKNEFLHFSQFETVSNTFTNVYDRKTNVIGHIMPTIWLNLISD